MNKKICEVFLALILVSMFFFSVSTVYAEPLENNPNWNIHFENLQIKEGSITAVSEPTIDDSSTQVTYSVNFDTPGQFYEFTLDVKNSGLIDGMLDEILVTSLTEEQQKYLAYVVTYNNGAVLTQYDKLNAGTSEKIKVRVELKKDITAEDLPTASDTFNLTLELRYVQADENAHDIVEPENPDQPGGNGENGGSSENGEVTNPDEKNELDDSNKSKEGNNKEQSGNKNNKSKGPQTGDSIIICFMIMVVAVIILIFTVIKRK